MIRFFNGHILEGLAVTDHEVWTDGDRIAYVGPARDDHPAFDREIDLRGDLLMPGFKNAHTHSAMTFLRSMADDLPLQDWLFRQVFPREAKLTPEHLASFARVAFLEYIANGITACFDMYFFTDELAALAQKWGFRVVFCDSLTSSNNWEDLRRAHEKYNAMGPFVKHQLGFHAEYTANLDMMKYVAEAAHDYKAPVWCHSSETKAEVEGCIERHGVTPTKLFDDLGLYDYGGGGYHCVWMTDEDIAIYKNRGLTAVLNACSNAKLASGIAPVGKLLDAGVNLAVGTDGPASNNALDMFREMYLINVLAKLRENNAAAGDPGVILQAAVSGGAKAMGLSDCDGIAPGKQADMIVIDMARPNMQPVHNIVKNLVYSGNPGNVKLTMIAGRVLYENGEFFVGEDIESVYRDADRHTRALMAEV